MTQTTTNSLAAIAAVIIAFTSIGTIVAVPSTSAHSADQMADTAMPMIELA